MKNIEKKIIQALAFKKYLNEIYSTINTEMFETDRNAFIFAIGKKLRDEGKNGDLTEILEYLSVNESDFYSSLNLDNLLVPEPIKNFRILLEMFIERYVKQKIANELRSLNVEDMQMYEISDYVQHLQKLISKYSSSKIPSVDVIKKELELAIHGSNERLIKTGFKQLDILLNGGYRSGISFVGAFTKVGKSCFARNLAYSVAKNHRIAYFNFEIDKFEFYKKVIAVYMQKEGLSPEKAMERFIADYENDRYIILNQHSRSLKSIISTIQYLVNEKGIEFVIIDTFDKMLNDDHDSWFGFTKNILELENVALSNDITLLLLKQINVEPYKLVKGEDGKWHRVKINPKCVRPDIINSVGTKEPMRTASSFITMFWNEQDTSIVHFVEQAERYNQAGMVDMYFDKSFETYTEVENSLFFL